MDVQVRFLKDDFEWAVVRTMIAFEHLWNQRRWDFVINGNRYSASDWHGREAAERMFGELVNVVRMQGR